VFHLQTKLCNKLIYLIYMFVLFVVCASSILIKVPFRETECIGQTYKHDPSAVVFALFIEAFSLQTLFDKHFRCLCKPWGQSPRGGPGSVRFTMASPSRSTAVPPEWLRG
jgi:hypothetical protein